MSNFLNLPPLESGEYKPPLVMLVGILFLLGGGTMLIRVPYLFYQWNRLTDAVVVPARILNLKHRSGGSGRSSSTTAEYEYSIAGKIFRSDRISIFSDSNGLYFRLREAYEAGAEVQCYVDPHEPRFSALERDIQVGDIIANFILGIPLSTAGFLYVVRHARSQRDQTHRTIRR